MTEKQELFSIKDGKISSLGARVEIGRILAGENARKVVPELAVSCSEEGMLNLIGNYIWQGGTLGELWGSQTETLQFIVDNIDII